MVPSEFHGFVRVNYVSIIMVVFDSEISIVCRPMPNVNDLTLLVINVIGDSNPEYFKFE